MSYNIQGLKCNIKDLKEFNLFKKNLKKTSDALFLSELKTSISDILVLYFLYKESVISKNDFLYECLLLIDSPEELYKDLKIGNNTVINFVKKLLLMKSKNDYVNYYFNEDKDYFLIRTSNERLFSKILLDERIEEYSVYGVTGMSSKDEWVDDQSHLNEDEKNNLKECFYNEIKDDWEHFIRNSFSLLEFSFSQKEFDANKIDINTLFDNETIKESIESLKTKKHIKDSKLDETVISVMKEQSLTDFIKTKDLIKDKDYAINHVDVFYNYFLFKYKDHKIKDIFKKIDLFNFDSFF